MSAEVLRGAAALMRERAEATGGEWYSAKAWATASPMSLPIEATDAAHIASWHPAVALAVADTLDLAAQWVEDHPGSWPPANKAALAVALAFLGERRDV